MEFIAFGSVASCDLPVQFQRFEKWVKIKRIEK